MGEQAADRDLSVAHHTVPRHALARFVNDDGRLTVLRKEPEVKVLRRQAPENVGVHNHLNNWRDAEGKWHDDLETGPLGNLDDVGKREIDQVLRFAVEADAEAHLRLARDQTLGERANLQLFVASLMVRTMGFREQFDATALPTLLIYMRERLEEQFAAGKIDKQMYDHLLVLYTTPGRIQVQAPDNRHVGLLIPLIEKVSMRLHLDTWVSVRRFADPLLFTGAEPVVVFPSADVFEGCSSGQLFAAGETPVEPWREEEKLLEQVDARMAEIAGIAVALDPHTLLLMSHADRDDGGKLAYISSQVPAEGLAGITNLIVAASSSWIAGRDDCEVLNVLIKSSGA
jgi:hypothetical protein